ncbi:unnamed protein product, partial [marine sediment metagenome]
KDKKRVVDVDWEESPDNIYARNLEYLKKGTSWFIDTKELRNRTLFNRILAYISKHPRYFRTLIIASAKDNELFTEHFTILIEFIKSMPIISERMYNFSEFFGFMNGNHVKTFFPIIKETLAEFITQIEELSDFGSQMHALYFLMASIKIGFNPELCAEVASDIDERTSWLKRGSMKVKYKLLPSLVEDFTSQISALLSTILTKLETSDFNLNEKVAAIFVEFLETIGKTPFMDIFLPQLK